MSDLPLTPLSKIPNFDPRTVAPYAVDDDLPSVEAGALTAEALRQRFLTPPVWEPEVRQEPRFTNRAAVPAAVLIPIIQPHSIEDGNGASTVLLTERSIRLANHSGQIAFPGGRVDLSDINVAGAAVREAHEEVGLVADFIEILGPLPLYTTGTGYSVTPIVGLVRRGFVLELNPDEVADAFEVPLEFLMNPANHRRHVFEWDGIRREWFSMPYRTGDTEHFIWGATAGILRNLYRFLRA